MRAWIGVGFACRGEMLAWARADRVGKVIGMGFAFFPGLRAGAPPPGYNMAGLQP